MAQTEESAASTVDALASPASPLASEEEPWEQACSNATDTSKRGEER
jgi:hypothetical protein